MIIEALKDIDPRYPKLAPAALNELAQAKAELEAETGGPAAALAPTRARADPAAALAADARKRPGGRAASGDAN